MCDKEDNIPPQKKPKLDSVDNIKSGNINTYSDPEIDFNIKKGFDSDKVKVSYDNEEGSSSKYDYVTPEELQKLREFRVLDEVNEGDSRDEDSDSSGKSEEFPDEEIEKMLDEDLPEDFKGAPKPKEKPYDTRQKIVLEEKGINHFEVLPLDWMMVRHCSGMPVYIHRSTRVCTLSKPYFLGKGNTRRHDIPISAIPCLSYRKALEEEEEQKKIDESIAEQIRNGTWAVNGQTNAIFKEPKKSKSFTTIREKNSSTGEASSVTGEISTSAVATTSKSSSITEETRPAPGEMSAGVGETSTEPGEASTGPGAMSNDVETSTLTGESNPNIEKNGAETSESVESSQQPTENNSCPFKKDRPVPRPVVLPGGIVMPPPRVEEVNTSWKSQHLSCEAVNNYCKKLFKFKTVSVMHFKRWADRRRYTKTRKALQYPALPDGTKLITIPAQPAGPDGSGKATKRDWVMNMNGCSYLSVFHEYVRRALQKQPVYEFQQLENAASPYQATVYIGGMQYGSGRGSSKRQAKSAAARASIHILIPEMKDELEAQLDSAQDAPDPDFSFFDYVGIEDPRVQEFSAAAAEPSPHAILRTCLLRNFGAGDRHIHTEMKKLEYQKIELTMKVGKHTATVVCKNKKQAKQTASQAILQALHPHIKSWGSLLRLYGSRSVKSCKEKKLEEQQITLLQDKAQQNAPNYAVLEKLRNEMRKLKERDEAVVPIGTLLVPEGLPSHSGSNLNNVDL